MRAAGVFLKRHWFVVLLLGMILLGNRWPTPGLLIEGHLGLTPFIIVVLFLSALTLKTEEILNSFRNLRGLGLALLAGYLFLPLAAWGFGHGCLRLDSGAGMRDLFVGFLIVGALPCTLASAAIWTRLGGGNDALALAVTVVSNGLNFLAAPAIFFCIVPAWVMMGDLPLVEQLWVMLQKILITIGLPIGAAQLLRAVGPLRALADRRKPELGVVAQALILTVVLVAVSKATHEVAKHAGDLQASAGGLGFAAKLALVLAGAAVIHVLALVFARSAARLGRLSPRDRLAVMMAGSQKTLPVGLYFASHFFGGYPLAVIPIIVYHAVQLTLDAFVAAHAAQTLKPAGAGETPELAAAAEPPGGTGGDSVSAEP